MLAKLTSKNQLTLPKAVTAAFPATEYYDVQKRGDEIVLRPVNPNAADQVREKLAKAKLDSNDIAKAIAWARQRDN